MPAPSKKPRRASTAPKPAPRKPLQGAAARKASAARPSQPAKSAPKPPRPAGPAKKKAASLGTAKAPKPGASSARATQGKLPRSLRGLAAETPGFVPEPLRDASRGPRLQRVLADRGVASRRTCEVLIAQGRVRVNGQVVSGLPAFIDPTKDRVDVDGVAVASVGPASAKKKQEPGKAAAAKGDSVRRVYLMLNKPKGYISTTGDEFNRPTVLDLVEMDGQLPGGVHRLYPVGRLDSESTGLILLTNDGDLTERLTHPRFEVRKVYQVRVRGIVTDADLGKIEKGLLLAPKPEQLGRAMPKRANVGKIRLLSTRSDREHGDSSVLEMTLHEGQNREIRRIFARLGYKVRQLHRVRLGPLKLKGVAMGEWRLLERQEVAELQKLLRSSGSVSKSTK